MNQPPTTHLLNRLLAIVGRSFPQYLQYSRPYIPSPGRDNLVETLDAIVADQNGLAERIGNLLKDAQAPIRTGDFPMEYTDLHDLDIDYLLRLAVKYQEQDVAAIGEIAEQLTLAPAAQSLTEEALGMAKGHLDTLLEVLPAATATG